MAPDQGQYSYDGPSIYYRENSKEAFILSLYPKHPQTFWRALAEIPVTINEGSRNCEFTRILENPLSFSDFFSQIRLLLPSLFLRCSFLVD